MSDLSDLAKIPHVAKALKRMGGFEIERLAMDAKQVPAVSLTALTISFRRLPHQSVRFRTHQGLEFLKLLHLVALKHSAREMSQALGVSVQSIHTFMARPRKVRRVLAYPSPEQIGDLLAVAPLIARTPRRVDEDFETVHLALHALLRQGFEIHQIALAIQVPVRKLMRFVAPPLPEPAEMAARIYRSLPRQSTGPE